MLKRSLSFSIIFMHVSNNYKNANEPCGDKENGTRNADQTCLTKLHHALSEMVKTLLKSLHHHHNFDEILTVYSGSLKGCNDQTSQIKSNKH